VTRGLLLVSSVAMLAVCTTGTAGTRVVYVSPRGSDAHRCTRASPCKSFDRAYRVATPGQTIELAGGTYPPQLIKVDPTKVHATKNVVFRPAPGARVMIAGELTM
jgi:hypothetical protein